MSWTSRPPLRSPFAPRSADDDAGDRPDGGDGAPRRVLTVCTGNICRSAYAHHVLQARLEELLGPGVVEVSSAGTGVDPRLRVPREVLDLAPTPAVRSALEAHRPRPLTGRVLAGQDLVLTATERHRDTVAREAPAALRRSATLLDAAALLAPDPAGVVPAGALTGAPADALDRGRATGRGLTGSAADLPDPWRGPVAGYRAMARALDPALETIARALAGLVRA